MDEPKLTRYVQVGPPEGDGRTLDGRLVPYNTVADVADPPSFAPYREMFMPGAFERQLQTPGRDKVLLNFEHEQGIRGTLGRAIELRDQQDGLHGSFTIRAGDDGDYALELVREGVLTGLSIEFSSKFKTVDGVRQRHQAHLDKVALCRFPAYEDAQVFAVRNRVVLRRETFDQELRVRLERLNVAVPGILVVS